MIAKRTLIDQYPWLKDLCAGSRWAWVMFHSYVVAHGRPVGVTNRVTRKIWAARLHSTVEEFDAMLAAATDAGHVIAVPGSRYYLPELADPQWVAPGTMRMRKHRRHKGGTVGYDGLPCFTRKDACDIVAVFHRYGIHAPPAFIEACVKGLNMMHGKVEDPKSHLINEAHTYMKKQSGKPHFMISPVYWLNQTVGHALGASEGFSILAPRQL